MLRLVLDTCVVIAAFRSRHGTSNQLLRAVARGRVAALVSTALFLEYEAVLTRPEQMMASGLDAAGAARALAGLAAVLAPVEIHFRWRPQLVDSADEMALETGVSGRADSLVTFNVRHFERAGASFGLAIDRPAAILTGLGP